MPWFKGTVGSLKEIVCEHLCSNSSTCSDVCKKQVIISDPKEMVKVFTDYFQSLQVIENSNVSDIEPLVVGVSLEDSLVSQRKIMLAVDSTRRKFAAGLDGFNGGLIKRIGGAALSGPQAKISQKSLDQSVLPQA